MKTGIATRLLALAGLGWAMLCPSASLAQAPDTNTDNTKPGIHRDLWISIGKDVELRAEDSAQEVVVIGGKAIIHGGVEADVEVIGGDVEIDGHVGGQVVAVMGDVHVSPKGKIDGGLLSVGGSSEVAEGGKVVGQIVDVSSGIGVGRFLRLGWVKDWFLHCVLELRPLAPGVAWMWWIAGLFFILYFIIAVLFPHPVQCCAAQISARPATTFVVGVVAKLAVPILCVLLPVTIVGVVVVPFLIVAALLSVLVGKTALLQCIGGKIGGGFGFSAGQRPLAAFLMGALLITLLYMVPVIGLLVFCIVSCWGLGAGVTAICIALRSTRPPPPPAPAAPPPPAPAASPPPVASGPLAPPLTPPQALAYPRAGFWERMGAGFLDLVLVGLTGAWVGPYCLLVAIAYFSGLWAWKGTTVGGVVLNLQVVRQDGQPLNFLMTFVRSLAAFFSAAIFFLGFFWIGWDRDKQGWHDKIAGTVVVRLPRAVSLVCY